MGRRTTRLWLCIGLIASLAAPAAAMPWSGVEPFVGRTSFERLLVDLEVPDDARIVASVLYDDYLDALTAAQAERRNLRARAGGDRLEAALSGAIFVEADELRRLRQAVHAVEPSIWPKVDRAARELLDGVASIGSASRAGAALRDARRRMWLEPRRADVAAVDYAGDGLDVAVLADEAGRDGELLSALPAGELAAVVDGYVKRLDAFLKASAADQRRLRWAIVDARLASDENRRGDGERELSTQWSAAYTIHREAADAIGELTRSRLGDETAEAWRDHFDQACFPAVFRPGLAEQQLAWIRRQVEDAAVLRDADRVAADHLPGRRTLRREAVRILVESRVRHGFALTLETRPDASADRAVQSLHMELLKNSGSMSALDRAMSSRLTGLLDESTRRRMTRAVRGAS